MKSRIAELIALLMALVIATNADATVQARLDHDHVAVGEQITLTIESDGVQGKPDLSLLRKDFQVQGIASGSQTTIVNGSMHSSLQWSITLVPTHAGILDVPALAVGTERTPPLKVMVDPASASAVAGSETLAPSADRGDKAGASAFIEDSVDQERPYVGQAVVYTLRLYYAVTLLDAALDLPAPDNGDARQIGDDQRGSQVVRGQRYDVLVRHYLLQPEHSGTLHVPAPVFQGRAMPDINNVMDDSLAVGSIQASGKALDVQVRPRPAQAGDPWLPARSITLSVDPLPPGMHAGEPFSLLVREDGEGVTASQLPEIALPVIAGAQVYPEPSSTIERTRDGSLQAERTRRFAVVPDRAGTLSIPELSVPWWDVVNDRAAIAHAAIPKLQVQPGTSPGSAPGNAASTPVASPAAMAQSVAAGSATGASRGWQIATLVLATLLAISLAWGWRRGQAEAAASHVDDNDESLAPRDARALERALEQGDPFPIAKVLCDVAPDPRPRHLHEVAQRLDDPSQRAAVLAFEAARWNGDGQPSPEVIAQLRAAFARSPRWTSSTRPLVRKRPLPPLYPD